MKTKLLTAVLLAAATLASTANADTLATIQNQACGKIEFTDVQCPTSYAAYFEGSRVVMSYDSSGTTQLGCWFWDAKMAVARAKWNNNLAIGTYPASMLTLVKTAAQ
jgi:hypothetical protein